MDPLAIFMLGGGGEHSPIVMLDRTITVEGGTNMSAPFLFLNNGDMSEVSIIGTISEDISPAYGALEWHEDNPSTVGADWEIFATVTAGPTPNTGSYDVWLSLGTNRSFGWASQIVSRDSTFDISIRRASDQKIFRTVTCQSITIGP